MPPRYKKKNPDNSFFQVNKSLNELDNGTVIRVRASLQAHWSLTEVFTDRPLTKSFTLAVGIESVTFWDTYLFLTNRANTRRQSRATLARLSYAQTNFCLFLIWRCTQPNALQSCVLVSLFDTEIYYFSTKSKRPMNAKFGTKIWEANELHAYPYAILPHNWRIIYLFILT